jgi:hypothetical protein
MKAELRTITPAWAKQMLEERNTGNRAMNRMHVEALAKEMKCGRWKVNGDTICVNASRVIDGQHRLAAVVSSGVTIQSFVVEGLPSDVFDTKDVGKRRSAADTLGVRGEINSYRLAACLIMIDKYVTGRADKQVTYSNTEVEELLQKYPGARNSLQTKANVGGGIIIPSVLDACHYLFSAKSPEMADEFVKKVLRGTELKEGDPYYLLRERLMRNSLAKAKLAKPYMMALCIKAWNHVRSGTSCRVLKYSEEGSAAEPYPVVR